MICRLLLLFILTSCVSAGSFVVNVTQTSYQAQENHSITLEWTFTAETDRSYKHLNIYCDLITDDGLFLLYRLHDGAEVSESQDEKFSGRVQSDKDALREGRIRLQLSRLRTDDSGRYRCQVITDDGLSSASCRLTVTAAADQLQPQRPTLTPQEETGGGGGGGGGVNVFIGVTAAVSLLALMVCALICSVLRKKEKRPNFCAAKLHPPAPPEDFTPLNKASQVNCSVGVCVEP
ncbi:uncharacterized protein LOC115776523 [Archocentrus centrarchus]|uniref:uncharacterized protein LOC115776523 n=1 Tax=Archocentrus centrarchus TaxID=63155 RepID=UPI0011EA12C3|nr:uncharacterized protein LOC115776523 [Archocentrus centrarchus]